MIIENEQIPLAMSQPDEWFQPSHSFTLLHLQPHFALIFHQIPCFCHLSELSSASMCKAASVSHWWQRIGPICCPWLCCFPASHMNNSHYWGLMCRHSQPTSCSHFSAAPPHSSSRLPPPAFQPRLPGCGVQSGDITGGAEPLMSPLRDRFRLTDLIRPKLTQTTFDCIVNKCSEENSSLWGGSGHGFEFVISHVWWKMTPRPEIRHIHLIWWQREWRGSNCRGIHS